MYTAATVIYPTALASSITLPMEILRAGSQMASTGLRGKPQIRFLMAGPDRHWMKLASGISLKPDLSLEELPNTDLLILPAIWRNPLPTVNSSGKLLAMLPPGAFIGLALLIAARNAWEARAANKPQTAIPADIQDAHEA